MLKNLISPSTGKNSDQDGAYDPFIAPDESYIIFSSIMTKGYGQADQYISYNRNGTWTNPKTWVRPSIPLQLNMALMLVPTANITSSAGRWAGDRVQQPTFTGLK